MRCSKYLFGLIILFFCGLSVRGGFSAPVNPPKPKCVATMSIIADMAKNISGGEITVVSLLPVGSDPHTYEPIPSDVQTLLSANLILKNGLNLEGWLDELINQSGTKAPIRSVTEGVKPFTDPEHAGSYDPHAWMNPVNGIVYAQNIAKAFTLILPEKKAVFEQRLIDYTRQLQETDLKIRNLLNLVPQNQRVLVTSHDAFRYFAGHYGWEVASALGTSTDAEVRTQDMKKLSETVRQRGLKAVFIESVTNPKLIEQIARDNGAVVGGKLFADSIGDSTTAGYSYITMLLANAQVISSGLLGQTQDNLANNTDHVTQSKVDSSHLTALFWVLVLVFLGGAAGTLAVLVRKNKNAVPLGKNFFLNVEGLWVSYDKKTVLANIYLEVESGKVCGLIGPNGSGKSTLFKTILGLVKPDAGKVQLKGHPIAEVQARIAYVPQKEEIDWQFPATVGEIVLTGRYAHVSVFQSLQKEDYEKARQAMERLEISDLKDKQISELSGGQQQRTFIARALCQEADVYLFDEPFVGVDVTTEAKIVDLLHELAREGKMVIIVHHDLAKVRQYFNSVILIHQRIIAYGDTATVFTPENVEKTFSGRSTIMDKSDRYL